MTTPNSSAVTNPGNTFTKNHARIIKELITEGREKGFITLDEINFHLASEIPTPEQLERIFNILAEIDIEVVDSSKNISLIAITGSPSALLI